MAIALHTCPFYVFIVINEGKKMFATQINIDFERIENG